MKHLLLTLVLLWTASAGATTIEELMADDKLRLTAWLEPEEGIVVGQEVRMLIQVSTPRWFAGGTRIGLPEIKGLVVLRRDEFATNLSRREAGVTWVVQQWQLELYPQREGEFTVPPVLLELAVNDADAGIVRGEVRTPELVLSAEIPPALQSLSRWLATPAFSIEQKFDRELTSLVPGDAFTRSVEIRASRVTAMMLPEVPVESIDGLAAYPEIPALENRSNRGEATAIRRQQITYVVEKPGQYELPEQQISWWNTATGELETATLQAVDIDAGTALSTAEGFTLPRISPRYLLLPLLALAVWALWLQWRRLRAKPLTRARAALKRGDASAAAGEIYRWLNGRPEDWLSLRASADAAGAGDDAGVLLRAGFSEGGAPVRSADSLIRKLRKARRRATSTQSLDLNPNQPLK